MPVLQPLSAPALKAMLAGRPELALVDLREELIFAQNHLLFARWTPLRRHELNCPRLVPRRGMRIVLCDDADGLVERASAILARAGYTNLHALAGGVAAWAKAGFELFSGVNVPSKAFGEFVEHAAATPSISAEELARLMHERSDFVVLDSRPFDEYQRVSIPTAVNVAGALSAPGGKLVQATDQYVGTPGARIVLIDPAEVRAVMTASWLTQMGWRDVYVLAQEGREIEPPATPILGTPPAADLRIDCAGLAALLARNEATVVDLSFSRDYLKAHIPGAWFAIRSRLKRALAKIPLEGTLVLTSEEGALAGRAVADARALVDRPARALDGGNASWRDSGHALTADEARMADEAVDVWLKPYERASDQTAAMRDYLSWEVDLPARVARDGSANFIRF